MTEVSRLLQAAIGDKEENEDTNEENDQIKDNTKDDRVQTQDTLIENNDFYQNDSNSLNIIDEPQRFSTKRIRTRPLNYNDNSNDSDDKILNSSTHC